jgi:eukaryotic-like serine/threonine-protein kinase
MHPAADGRVERSPSEQLDASAATAALREIALEPPPRFGPYELLGEHAAGTTATVYEARDPAGAIVALKCLERPRSPVDVERFWEEAKLTSSLSANPNIIPVRDIGKVDGVPYYATPFMEGGTLVDWYARADPGPEALAGVMAQIARAVHAAHTHKDGTVLHRDLKPANILMDAAGAPFVADFGIAKRLEPDTTGTRDGLVGTLDYMAPEQALGDAAKLTPAADIYSLGVVLYELLTGDVPVRGATVAEFLQRLWSAEPIVLPHELVPGDHRGLENICLKCLDNNPQRRYRSADALARDFDRAREGKRPIARPPSWPLRAARWVRRHPRTSYAVATAVALVVVAGVSLSVVWRARQREQERILDANASIASSQAGAALFQFREYARHVVDTARHRTVRTIVTHGDVRLHAPELEPLVGDLDYLIVMTADGFILAEWPSGAPDVYRRSFEFRDYFRGARQLAESGTPGAYIARASRSESRGALQFSISTPIRDERGKPVGVLVGGLKAQSAFGGLRMEESPQDGLRGRIITALIGPRGNDRALGPDAPAPSDFTFLVHPGMERGLEYPVRSPHPAMLRERVGVSAPPGHQLSLQYGRGLQLGNHRDPIPGFEDGEWLAALAPVGKTGYMVLVETPKEPDPSWLRALRGPIGGRVVPGALFVIVAGGFLLRSAILRRRRAAENTADDA